MAVLFPIRKPCPVCGRPMKLVPDDAERGPQRFVCAACEDDPLHDPAARKWADSSLKPPAK